MRTAIHLHFPGTCAEALRFYAKLLGGKITILQTYGESPCGDVPAAWKEKIVHGAIRLGNVELMGADVLKKDYRKPAGFNVLIQVPGLAKTRSVYKALAKGGAAVMPLQKTFWSPAFGVVVDRFGVPWEVTVEG